MSRRIEPTMGNTHETVLDAITKDLADQIQPFFQIKGELSPFDSEHLERLSAQKNATLYLRNALMGSGVCLTEGHEVLVRQNIIRLGNSGLLKGLGIETVYQGILQLAVMNLIQASRLSCDDCLNGPCADRDPLVSVDSVKARIRK